MRFRDALDLIRAAVFTAALFLLGGVVPVLGALVMLCAPAPALFHALRRPDSYWRMLAVVGLSTALIGGAVGPLQALGFALSLGLCAFLILVMVRRQWPFELIVVATTAAMMATMTAVLLMWAGSPAVLAKALHDSMAAAMSHADGFYQKMGLSLAESRKVSEKVLSITTTLVPALAAILGALTVLVNLGLLWKRLGKARLGYQLFGGLTKWHAPEWLIWVLLITGFGLFLPLEPMRVVASNGFVFTTAIYFCQGLAIVAYYLQMLAMPMMVRGMVYVIALIQPILAAVVCLAGVFDMWIDFRRLKPPSPQAGSYDDFH